jgi:hypothetical protein
MMLLAILLCPGRPDSDELPFEEPDSPSPTATPSPTPTPTAAPAIQVPYSRIFGATELAAALIGLLYIIFYFAGGILMEWSMRRASRSLGPAMRRHFHVVPSAFRRLNNHQFNCWVTGRRGYLGCLVTARFSMRCEPLGWLFDRLTGRPSHLVFEFVCEPAAEEPAIFSLRHSQIDIVREHHLTRRAVPGLNLGLFSDFGSAEEPFVDLAREFAAKWRHALWAIDLSNCNRFETAEAGKIIARVEFIFGKKPIENVITEELIDFVVKIADAYVTLRLPDDVREQNVRKRAEQFTGLKPKSE